MDQIVETTRTISAIRDQNPDTGAPRDLRRVGAHPDHWYPIAWSREVKPGAHAGGAVRRRPDRADKAGRARCSRWRIAARIARCRCSGRGGRRVDPLRLSRLDLRLRGPLHRRAVSRPRTDCRTACVSYPCREEDGLIFVFPGRCGAERGGDRFRRWVPSADRAVQDASVRARGGAAITSSCTRT